MTHRYRLTDKVDQAIKKLLNDIDKIKFDIDDRLNTEKGLYLNGYLMEGDRDVFKSVDGDLNRIRKQLLSIIDTINNQEQ